MVVDERLGVKSGSRSKKPATAGFAARKDRKTGRPCDRIGGEAFT